MKSLTYFLLIVFLFSCQSSGKLPKTKTAPVPEKETTWQQIDIDREDIKTLRIIIHVFNKSDGSGSFQKEVPEHKWFLKDMVKAASKYFSEMKPHIPSHVESVADAKIRLKLEKVYHWNNDTAYNCSTVGAYTHRHLYKQYVIENAEISKEERKYALHVLLPGKRPNKYGGRNLTGLGFITNALYFEGWFQVFEKTLWGDIPANFAHEVGHGLGLPHYEDSYFACYACDDNNDCPQEGCNNLMRRNGGGPALSLCQLKVAHFLLKNGPSGLNIYNQKARANELIIGYNPPVD